MDKGAKPTLARHFGEIDEAILDTCNNVVPVALLSNVAGA